MQVKLFVELFSSKFQSHMFKLLKAANDEEATEAGRAFEHNLEVTAAAGLVQLPIQCNSILRMQAAPRWQMRAPVEHAAIRKCLPD